MTSGSECRGNLEPFLQPSPRESSAFPTEHWAHPLPIPASGPRRRRRLGHIHSHSCYLHRKWGASIQLPSFTASTTRWHCHSCYLQGGSGRNHSHSCFFHGKFWAQPLQFHYHRPRHQRRRGLLLSISCLRQGETGRNLSHSCFLHGTWDATTATPLPSLSASTTPWAHPLPFLLSPPKMGRNHCNSTPFVHGVDDAVGTTTAFCPIPSFTAAKAPSAQSQ